MSSGPILECGHGQYDVRHDCLTCLQFTVRVLNGRLQDQQIATLDCQADLRDARITIEHETELIKLVEEYQKWCEYLLDNDFANEGDRQFAWEQFGAAKEFLERCIQREAQRVFNANSNEGDASVPAATQEPAGSGATLQYQGDAEAFRQVMQQHREIVMKIGWCQGETFEQALERYVGAPGSPRKVGEDGAQTFEQWWQAEGVHMVRTTHRTGYELMREAWNAVLVRPSSVPVGEPRPACICAQGVMKCPRHGEQPAHREPCPLCGAPLGYCAEGEYCTKEDCKYVA